MNTEKAEAKGAEWLPKMVVRVEEQIIYIYETDIEYSANDGTLTGTAYGFHMLAMVLQVCDNIVKSMFSVEFFLIFN